MKNDLGDLTAGEKLWLWRRRQRAASGSIQGRGGGIASQRETAERLGLAPGSYLKLEGDGRARLSLGEALDVAAVVGDLEPTVAELCALARRRSRVTLARLQAELGLGRDGVLRAERAADAAVVELWRRRGYAFPEGGDDRCTLSGD